MQTDVIWNHQPMAAHQERDLLPPANDEQHPHPLPDWDPSSFLNPSMLSTPDFLAPGAAQHYDHNHLQGPSAQAAQSQSQFQSFQQQQHQQQQHQQSQQHPQQQQQPPHPHPHQGLQQQHSQQLADHYEPQFDVYQTSVPSSFDARFPPQSAAPQSSADGSLAHPQSLNGHEFGYLPIPAPGFGAQNASDVSHLHSASQPHQQSLSSFDLSALHQASPITPSEPSPLHRNHSPYTVSPASNHSFGAQQDYSSVFDRRPSTADSVHSLHGEYTDDYHTTGVVPSALHPFSQRGGYLHMPQDVQSRSFVPHPGKPQHQPNAGSYNPQQQQQQLLPHQGGSYPPYGSSAQFIPEQAVHVAPHSLDESPLFPTPAPLTSNGADTASFIRPVLQKYVEAPNRIGFGERTVIVMASKVAQKSYGQERRFLCPPPTAIMIGNAWWNESASGRDDRRPPRVTVSISGESVPPECNVEWVSTAGKPVDTSEPPAEEVTYIGRAVGKQLFISDERQKKVEALVKIVAPSSSEDEPERVIGTFPSRPIKVISKPSKKRQSAKNMELCINHGSTVSLFHRLRSQTVSTKYLCVSGSGSSFKTSDGQSLPGIDPRTRGTPPSFVARTGTWDPFIIYIVDVTKPLSGPDIMPPAPFQPDYPSPPPNAIAVTHHGAHIPIYYNQTVVLQCLTSGVVSPVLIIRKVDHDTVVVGGGLQDGAKGVPDHFCAPGEVCGDPVSQLHKVAFEVYDATKGVPQPGNPGITSAFLSCMGEKVNTYRPSEGRTWNSTEHSSGSQSPSIPDSPGASSSGSLTDYFSPTGSPTTSTPSSPMMDHSYSMSTDGGRVRRTKRSGSGTNNAPLVRTTSKARRRVNSVGNPANGAANGGGPIPASTRYGLADQAMSSGALWSIDIGESAVWTIVGTEQIRYNFYVPPGIPGVVAGVPPKPVTPFPNIVKYLPPDRAAENPKMHMSRTLMKPDPRSGMLLTVYGENFNKSDPPLVFFGSEPSPFVDVRCQEVLACMPPEVKLEPGTPRPIFIVRSDGIVYPSNVVFYDK